MQPRLLVRITALASLLAIAGQSQAPAGSGGVNQPAQQQKPYVVLVSFDGLRADFLDRFEAPNFQRVMRQGTRAKSLIPVFPSLTFPAHYSIATGMYADRHGIVGMNFFDPSRGETFGTTMFFGTDTFSGRATMVQRSRFNFMREAQIWYSRDHPDQRTLSSAFENVIVLSDELYQELMAHPIPNDLEAVKVLAASPAVLDLFM